MRKAIWVLAAAAVLAGCGGGDGNGGSSSASFVADGNQICKEDNAKFKALGRPQSSNPRDYLDKLMPLAEKDLARLKGLSPPSDEAAVYSAWISDLEQGTALSRRAQEAPSANTATKILEGSLAINKSADAKATQLGLHECLTGAGTGSS